MTDIIYKISNLMYKSFPEDAEGNYKDEALLETICTSPVIGQLVDAYDVKFLMSIFKLSDDDFREEFNGISDFPRERRLEAVEAIEKHFERCRHCALKQGFDYVEDARIKTFCRENSSLILEMMDRSAEHPENSETAEGDHRAATA